MIEIRPSAVERAMGVQEVILRAILELQIVAVCVTLMVAEVGRMTAGPYANRRLDGRKVRTPQGRVLGNAQGG